MLASLVLALAQQPAEAGPPLSRNLAALLADDSGLRTGERIAFFGDSITWQGGYIAILERALAAHAPDRHVKLLRRGVDGAKSKDVLAVVRRSLAEDRPTVAVVSIGLNDVWWPGESDTKERFEQNLWDVIAAAADESCRVVLCTPTTIGELPRRANEHDAKLDEYSEIVRNVAFDSTRGLADARAAFTRWLDEHGEPGRDKGQLTYDGVHMLPAGNALLADAVARGIAQALQSSDEVRFDRVLPSPRPKHDEAWTNGTDGTISRGSCSFGPLVRIATSFPELREHLAVFARELRIASTCAVEIADAASPELDVLLALDSSIERGYRLEIRPERRPRAVVSGRSLLEVAWGTTTLIQHVDLRRRSGTSLLPGRFADAPEFEFRALLVDVARQPHRIATLEQLIDLCRFYKIAYLQLHLTDDQAFTLPSTAFPALVTPSQHFSREELVSLVEFARVRGVALIPEIEMPGHAGAMIAAMPELFRAHPLHHATLDFASERVLEALDALLAEAAAIFTTSPYLHIGGDEADLEHVAESESFREAFRREGVGDAHELYVRFLARMNETVERLGRRTLVWEGFGPDSGSRVPKDVTVVAYESLYYPPDQLVRDGFRIVNASWKPLYVVNERCWSPREVLDWNPFFFQHFLPDFPAYDGLQLEPGAPVVGAMMCAWEQPDARELPSLRERLAAFSQRTWSPRSRLTKTDFERRLSACDDLLTRLLAAH